MPHPALDRRKHGHFRILYIDFGSFWNRLIREKKGYQRTPVRPKAAIRPKTDAAEPRLRTFDSGVEQLDEQHLGIRDAILKLQKDLRAGLRDRALVDALDSLLQRMKEHFYDEEAHLERIGFPDVQQHMEEHDQFRIQVAQLRDRVDTGDAAVALELSTFLYNWFKNHTLQEDSAFSKGHPPR